MNNFFYQRKDPPKIIAVSDKLEEIFTQLIKSFVERSEDALMLEDMLN